MTSNVIDAWHGLLKSKDPQELDSLLSDDVVFYSPVVHTPQEGKAITTMYLTAALSVFANDSFHYVREVIDNNNAVLEFETNIDGIIVNGVDMITWNDENKIISFKVMVRPLKAINHIHKMMGDMLLQLQNL